ncbi:MAG: holin, BlyA family protein [Lachnospiraceae bacterium]|nr:holin, BlyA family protein [Lachnospiraceae bacterium]
MYGRIEAFFAEKAGKFFSSEDGVGVVEVILILLVLVGLVIIFKEQIVGIAKSIFSNISNQVNTI